MTCPVCGALVSQPAGRAGRKIYCSPTCRRLARQARRTTAKRWTKDDAEAAADRLLLADARAQGYNGPRGLHTYYTENGILPPSFDNDLAISTSVLQVLSSSWRAEPEPAHPGGRHTKGRPPRSDGQYAPRIPCRHPRLYRWLMNESMDEWVCGSCGAPCDPGFRMEDCE